MWNGQSNDEVGKFSAVLSEMQEIFRKKNADYGNAFKDMYSEYGLIYPVMHLREKLNRIESIMKNGKAEVSNESIKDSLQDMANYCVMTLIEIDDDNK